MKNCWLKAELINRGSFTSGFLFPQQKQSECCKHCCLGSKLAFAPGLSYPIASGLRIRQSAHLNKASGTLSFRFQGDKRIWRSPLRCPSVHQRMQKKKYWEGLQKHRKHLAIWWKQQKLMYAFIIWAPWVALRLCSPAASPPPVPLLVVWWWFISLSTELDKTLPTMLNWSDECSACLHSINPRGKLPRDARAGISMRQYITLQSPVPNTAEYGHQHHF